MNKFSRSLTQCNVPGDRPDIFANLFNFKYFGNVEGLINWTFTEIHSQNDEKWGK